MNGPRHAFGRRDDMPPEDTVTARQVHGTRVLWVEGGSGPLDAEGDALITGHPGTCVGVRTADCLPILLSARDGRVAGAVHAGWRGAVAGVAQEAVKALKERFGVEPREITARLGPCIRPCCFEVGPEVRQAVAERHPRWVARLFTSGKGGRDHLDLAGLSRLQLEEMGVADIEDAGACTCCNPGTYYSYRRDGEAAGRMVSWIRAAGE